MEVSRGELFGVSYENEFLGIVLKRDQSGDLCALGGLVDDKIVDLVFNVTEALFSGRIESAEDDLALVDKVLLDLGPIALLG